MDYKKKSLKKLRYSESYEEIDARLASGWYVDSFGNSKKKEYKNDRRLQRQLKQTTQLKAWR